MSRFKDPASVLKRQYLVQVPRKRPTCKNAFKDNKNRVWIKASDYNVGNFSMWQQQDPDTFYVWFNNKSEPYEGEVVFDNFKISYMYRVERLLRCVVELEYI